eukprot:scaffold319830_cov40-Prasinocladus_malaysianus.AAC.1
MPEASLQSTEVPSAVTLSASKVGAPRGVVRLLWEYCPRKEAKDICTRPALITQLDLLCHDYDDDEFEEGAIGGERYVQDYHPPSRECSDGLSFGGEAPRLGDEPNALHQALDLDLPRQDELVMALMKDDPKRIYVRDRPIDTATCMCAPQGDGLLTY